MCFIEKKTYVNIRCNLEIHYLLMVLLSIPFDKLPWVFGFTIISRYIPVRVWPGWGQSMDDNTKKEYSDPHFDVHTIEDVWPMTLNMRII